MTDDEYAKAIADARQELNEAIADAVAAGLHVTLDAGQALYVRESAPGPTPAVRVNVSRTMLSDF